MKNLKLEVNKRKESGKQNKVLRESGIIPGILYGHGVKNVPIKVKLNDFQKVYQEAGQSTLVDLKIENGESQKVIISDPQFDPISDLPIHIDFIKVKMTEKIKTDVPIKTTGESLAVKDLDGNLILNKDKIEIECLPQDLIHEVKVDISSLKTFDNKILVKDLKVPDTVTILDDPKDVAVLVTPPRSEEELEALDEEVEEKVDDIEVEKEKKEEEAEVDKESEEGKKQESETQPQEQKPEENQQQKPQESK